MKQMIHTNTYIQIDHTIVTRALMMAEHIIMCSDAHDASEYIMYSDVHQSTSSCNIIMLQHSNSCASCYWHSTVTAVPLHSSNGTMHWQKWMSYSIHKQRQYSSMVIHLEDLVESGWQRSGPTVACEDETMTLPTTTP